MIPANTGHRQRPQTLLPQSATTSGSSQLEIPSPLETYPPPTHPQRTPSPGFRAVCLFALWAHMSVFDCPLSTLWPLTHTTDSTPTQQTLSSAQISPRQQPAQPTMPASLRHTSSLCSAHTDGLPTDTQPRCPASSTQTGLKAVILKILGWGSVCFF